MTFVLPDLAMAGRLQSKPHIALVGGVWVWWPCPHYERNKAAMQFCRKMNEH